MLNSEQKHLLPGRATIVLCIGKKFANASYSMRLFEERLFLIRGDLFSSFYYHDSPRWLNFYKIIFLQQFVICNIEN
jgi:hypothetical protein